MGEGYDKDDAQHCLKARRDLPDVHGIYRHYKGGLYVVLSVGLVESVLELLRALGVSEQVIETLPATVLASARPTILVAYRSNARETTWVRPLSHWEEVVTWPDGDRRPRFVQEPH